MRILSIMWTCIACLWFLLPTQGNCQPNRVRVPSKLLRLGKSSTAARGDTSSEKGVISLDTLSRYDKALSASADKRDLAGGIRISQHIGSYLQSHRSGDSKSALDLLRRTIRLWGDSLPESVLGDVQIALSIQTVAYNYARRLERAQMRHSRLQKRSYRQQLLLLLLMMGYVVTLYFYDKTVSQKRELRVAYKLLEKQNFKLSVAGLMKIVLQLKLSKANEKLADRIRVLNEKYSIGLWHGVQNFIDVLKLGIFCRIKDPALHEEALEIIQDFVELEEMRFAKYATDKIPLSPKLTGFLFRKKRFVKNPENFELLVNPSDVLVDDALSRTIMDITGELLCNSAKHAFCGGEDNDVTLRFVQRKESFSVVYLDNGKGFSTEVLRGENWSDGMNDIHKKAKLSGGSISLHNDSGAVITLTFPI